MLIIGELFIGISSGFFTEGIKTGLDGKEIVALADDSQEDSLNVQGEEEAAATEENTETTESGQESEGNFISTIQVFIKSIGNHISSTFSDAISKIDNWLENISRLTLEKNLGIFLYVTGLVLEVCIINKAIGDYYMPLESLISIPAIFIDIILLLRTELAEEKAIFKQMLFTDVSLVILLLAMPVSFQGLVENVIDQKSGFILFVVFVDFVALTYLSGHLFRKFLIEKNYYTRKWTIPKVGDGMGITWKFLVNHGIMAVVSAALWISLILAIAVTIRFIYV